MALQKQLVPLPIERGLDTKFDSKQEEPGFVRAAENIVYETIRKFKKRNGYDALLTDMLDGSELTGLIKLMKYKSELLGASLTRLFSYSEAREAWTDKGPLYASDTRTNTVIKNSLSQNQIDGIVVDNFEVYCWADSVNDVRYSVRDSINNNFLVSDALIEGSAERPVLGQINNVVYIIYGVGTAIKFKSFSILNPTQLSSATTVANNRSGSVGLIDAQSLTGRVMVAYNSTVVGANLRVFSILDGSVVSSITGVTSAVASNALDLTVDSLSRVIISFSDGTTLKAVIYPPSLSATLLAITTIDTANISTCCVVEEGPGLYKFYYEVVQSGQSNNYVKQADMTVAGTVSGISVFKRSVGLASRAFRYNDINYIPTVHESTLQSTYFLFDENGFLVTKYANQLASSVVTYGVLTETTAASATSFLIPNLFKNRLQSDNGTFFSTTGLQSSIVEFSPTSRFSNAELAESLHIAAGILRMYDGNSVVEHGFNVFPEVLSSSAPTTTGGFLSDGNYAYVAVYKWTDNTGKDHRSAPTQVPLTVVLSGGTTTQTVTITIPTLRITDKSSVSIELYRTENAGTQYYKVTNDLSPLLNNTAVDTVNFIDTVADTALISREALYTTGGTLENIVFPAIKEVTVYNGNRIAAIGEQKNRVIFSKEVTEGTPVEPSDFIYRDVDPVGGDLTTLRAMNDKLVLFSNDSSFWMSGEGPNNLGQQDTFTRPEILSTDIGCISPDSIARLPSGLMFKSRKGIWLCGAGLQLEYIGARVEKYNPDLVTSAEIVGELNQVRFLLSRSTALVYNYNLDRWGTFENHGGQSSVTIQNDYFYLREDGAVYKENRTKFADNSSAIKMRIETSWISFAGIQGYQRAYFAILLMDFKSLHKLRVKVAYDFKEGWNQEVLINPTDFIDAAAYGDESPYGSGTPYGSDGNLYQVRIRFRIQKCQSIKLLIEDAQDIPGEGMSLSSIAIMAGAKAGENKLPNVNTYGTK